MIVQERMAVYINSLDTGNGPFLDALQRQALQDEVPIIRQDMQSFLKVLLAVHQPKKILEVGTAVGFSALLMADHTSEECQITTIEKYEKRIPAAKENFKKAGRENRITLLEGDALEIMKGLNESYDMIFMDAAKGQYIHFLPDALRRNRTIYKRMREYLYVLKHTDGLLTSIVPVGDGAAVTVKQKDTICL